jgi:carbamoyltransferase
LGTIFKREKSVQNVLEKISMIVLGISCYYHDSAACIIKDGKIIAAAAEERFTRVKHDNSFPKKAIEFCLDSLRISANEVDIVSFYEKPFIKFERIISQHLDNFPKNYKQFIKTIGPWFGSRLQIKKTLQDDINYFGKVQFNDHHLSHAASAFYLAPYKKSAIVTVDGVGEWATTTVGVGSGKKIKIDKEVHFPHSLGLLYSTITTYLGFSANNSEYKVMGLAAYGDPKPFEKHFDKIIEVFDDGSFKLNMEYFDFDWANRMPSKKMVQLFDHPIRKKENAVRKYHENIAASLQRKLEEVVFKLLTTVHKTYKTDNLCFAGGVALNSVLNGKILSNTPFKKLFIPPDPSDAGAAMGTAMYSYTQVTGKLVQKKNFHPYLGPEYRWHQIETVLKKHNLKFKFIKDDSELTEKTAQLIKRKKVIGWFQGRMEWGPRALGNRSILGSATSTKMRDIINAKVKKREMFRPFAPVILEERTKEYFETDDYISPSARWMLMVYPFKKIGFKQVPAVVHVDNSGRLETLIREDNPRYYDLISAYDKKTGIPIIINTSFNVRGEPIVCDPEDAVQCFLKTDIDNLVIDNYIVSK